MAIVLHTERKDGVSLCHEMGGRRGRRSMVNQTVPGNVQCTRSSFTRLQDENYNARRFSESCTAHYELYPLPFLPFPLCTTLLYTVCVNVGLIVSVSVAV